VSPATGYTRNNLVL